MATQNAPTAARAAQWSCPGEDMGGGGSRRRLRSPDRGPPSAPWWARWSLSPEPIAGAALGVLSGATTGMVAGAEVGESVDKRVIKINRRGRRGWTVSL